MPPNRRAPESDNLFLNNLSLALLIYLWEQADPGTGLVRDRAQADGTSFSVASTAATESQNPQPPTRG
jgi:hypothetical protein